MNKKIYFWTGTLLLVFLISSYFIKFETDSGLNYSTRDSLLGILIFHNIFVLAFYVAIIIFFISKGIRIKK